MRNAYGIVGPFTEESYNNVAVSFAICHLIIRRQQQNFVSFTLILVGGEVLLNLSACRT
jgi:hypothetical protein